MSYFAGKKAALETTIKYGIALLSLLPFGCQILGAVPGHVSLHVNSPTLSSVKLSWNLPEEMSGIAVERSTGKQGIFVEILNSQEKPRDYTDQGLSPGTMYCYRARGFSTNLFTLTYSSYSSTECAKTLSDETPLLSSTGNQFYVDPNGSPAGKGTRENPWDLQSALNQPAVVRPGDTISLRGGRYRGIFVSRLRGEINKPIIVRSQPGAKVALDGGSDLSNYVLDVKNPSVIFMGLEIWRSEFNRNQNGHDCGSVSGGIHIRAGNVKVINCIVHDTSLGIAAWSQAPNAEISGNVIFYNGWIDVNHNRACDHGIYVHNREGSITFKDNIVFQNFRTGITPHGTSAAYLNNVELEGNIIFCNGCIQKKAYPDFGQNISMGYWGGSTKPHVIQNPKLIENYTYYPQPLQRVSSFYINYSTDNAIVKRNYWIGGLLFREGSHSTGFWNSNVILADRYEGNWTPTSEPQNAYYSWNHETLPFAAIVRQNLYDPNRSQIVVYNFKKLDSVKVDISNLGWKPGETYEIRNVQDYFGDILKGTYDGSGHVIVSMVNHSVATPVDWTAPAGTFPEFGAFVLIRKQK